MSSHFCALILFGIFIFAIYYLPAKLKIISETTKEENRFLASVI
jgi:hypothetical protein